MIMADEDEEQSTEVMEPPQEGAPPPRPDEVGYSRPRPFYYAGSVEGEAAARAKWAAEGPPPQPQAEQNWRDRNNAQVGGIMQQQEQAGLERSLDSSRQEMLTWAAEAKNSRDMNSRLALSREAVRGATEFVRRKEVERMVRDGTPLEEAEFKSRVKFNTANGGQLNALRPVRPPTAMEVGGVPGVTTGRGDQWKPFPNKPAPKPTQEELDQKTWNVKMKQKDSRFYDEINKALRERSESEDDPDKQKKIDAKLTALNQQRARLQHQLKAGQSLKVGTVYGKHRFKGGNPANKDSWETVD